MERAAPPRRRIPSVGDAVSFFAALLGLVLLVASARHLFWSDSEVAPLEVAPLARVTAVAAPVAQKRADSRPAARARRARPVSGVRHDVAPHATVRHDVARSDVNRHDVAPHDAARKALRSQPVQRSRPIAHRGEQHSRKIGQRLGTHAAPGVRAVKRLVRPSVQVAQQHPQARPVRVAAASSRIPSSPKSPHHSVGLAAQHPPARIAFVGKGVERRARARAAIIEPPLGFQTHVTLVELPAALGLDLGRDPIPALQIRLKHRH